jgi:hypothetical protein
MDIGIKGIRETPSRAGSGLQSSRKNTRTTAKTTAPQMRLVSLDEGIQTSLREKLNGWQNLVPTLSVPTYMRSLLITPEKV